MKELQTIKVKTVTTREDANEIIRGYAEIVRRYVEGKLEDYHMQQPACDMRYSLPSIQEGNPYEGIIYAATIIHNSLIEGWYFFFEAERLRRELEALKWRTIEDGRVRVIQ